MIPPARFAPLIVEQRMEPPIQGFKWEIKPKTRTDLDLEMRWRQARYEDPPYRPIRRPPRTPDFRFPIIPIPPFGWGKGGGSGARRGRAKRYARKQIVRPIGDIKIFGKKENLYGTKFLNKKTVSSILELGKK